jgi:hypothetical protein
MTQLLDDDVGKVEEVESDSPDEIDNDGHFFSGRSRSRAR